MISICNNNQLLKKINNNWIFDYIIALLYIAIGIIGWKYSYSYAGMGIIGVTIILLFLLNDFKYFIPACLCIIFSYNGGYNSNAFPIEIAAYGGLLIVLVVLYTFLNFRISMFKKPKSIIGFMLLSISCMIPIFWNKVITIDNKLMYFIYFSWILYVVVYFVFGINLGKNSLRMFMFTISFLPILLTFECAYVVIQNMKANPNANFLDSWYYVGWGLCNEVGIILCFCLPFIFYQIIKSKYSVISIFSVILLFVSIIGIVFTTSRGSYLFGALEIIIGFILCCIFSKKKITFLFFFVLFTSLGVLFIELYYGIGRLFEDIKNITFNQGLGVNGREIIWNDAKALWGKNWLTKIFGSGIVSQIDVRSSFNGEDSVFIVYHSTFFEVLVMGGIFGIISLLVHFFEKYKQLWKKELPFALVMLVGYLAVDAYGMIDNTYGMYYYMIPLVILMAAMDNDKNTGIFNNNSVIHI